VQVLALLERVKMQDAGLLEPPPIGLPGYVSAAATSAQRGYGPGAADRRPDWREVLAGGGLGFAGDADDVPAAAGGDMSGTGAGAAATRSGGEEGRGADSEDAESEEGDEDEEEEEEEDDEDDEDDDDEDGEVRRGQWRCACYWALACCALSQRASG